MTSTREMKVWRNEAGVKLCEAESLGKCWIVPAYRDAIGLRELADCLLDAAAWLDAQQLLEAGR